MRYSNLGQDIIAAMNLKKNTSKHGRITAVSMMKDEAPYLLEWFAHHMAVGFTDILVYTNDCSDGTDTMLMRLEELGLGYHRRNDIPEGIKPQPSALKYAQVEPIVQDSDWVMVFDADEFLNVKYGDGTLTDLISAAGKADGIVVTWRSFGSGGVVDWSRQSVTEQYQYAAPELWNKGWGVKTLFKFKPEHWKLGIHRPKMKRKSLETNYPDSIQWLNGSGLPMEDYFKYRGWRSIRRTVGYNWVQLNHYAVKSVDAYALRKLRGNVNNKKDKYNADYWALQDRNEIREPSVLRHAAARDAILKELLKDKILSKLHYAAIEKVEAKLDEIRLTKAYQTLKAELLEASKVPITQVAAKPPKARDPAKIAALMSSLEKRDAKRPKSERRSKQPSAYDTTVEGDVYATGRIDLTSDVRFEQVANHDIMLPADPRVFTPGALDQVASGKFERRAARYILQYILPNDRLLNIGAGLCFIPIFVVKSMSNVTVMAQEERSVLAKLGQTIATTNGLANNERLKIVDGPLIFVNDTEGFASGLMAYIADFNPSVIRFCSPSITPEIVENADFGNTKRLIFANGFGDDTQARFSNALNAQGFKWDANVAERILLARRQ